MWRLARKKSRSREIKHLWSSGQFCCLEERATRLGWRGNCRRRLGRHGRKNYFSIFPQDRKDARSEGNPTPKSGKAISWCQKAFGESDSGKYDAFWCFVSEFDIIEPIFDEFYLKICAKLGEMLPKFGSASGGTGGSVESSRDIWRVHCWCSVTLPSLVSLSAGISVPFICSNLNSPLSKVSRVKYCRISTWRTPLVKGVSELMKLTSASLSEKIWLWVGKSGSSSRRIWRRRRSVFSIVVSPSSSASKQDRQVAVEVVAFAWIAPEVGPRAEILPSTDRRRGPVPREASVQPNSDSGEVPPKTRGKPMVVKRYPIQ